MSQSLEPIGECANCGGSIYRSEHYIMAHNGAMYCSDECKQEGIWSTGEPTADVPMSLPLRLPVQVRMPIPPPKLI